MERNQTNLLQGTLDLLILKAIGDGEMHGLGIARRVEQLPAGHFRSSLVRSFRPFIAWKRLGG